MATSHRYRYDHVLASREVAAVECADLHKFRLNTKHQAVVLVESPR